MGGKSGKRDAFIEKACRCVKRHSTAYGLFSRGAVVLQNSIRSPSLRPSGKQLQSGGWVGLRHKEPLRFLGLVPKLIAQRCGAKGH